MLYYHKERENKSNLSMLKGTVKRWRVSKDDKLIEKANELAKVIKQYKKSQFTIDRLMDYFYWLN